eukprot:2813392-Ditylum_brightwellii.AAC.1
MMAEVGGGHHRMLILPHICCMWKVVRSLMVELEAGHHILFIPSWCPRSTKGDKNCHGKSMSSSSQIINSQTRLSTSRTSDGWGKDNGSCRSGNQPSKRTYETNHLKGRYSQQLSHNSSCNLSRESSPFLTQQPLPRNNHQSHSMKVSRRNENNMFSGYGQGGYFPQG